MTDLVISRDVLIALTTAELERDAAVVRACAAEDALRRVAARKTKSPGSLVRDVAWWWRWRKYPGFRRFVPAPHRSRVAA